MLRKPGAKYAIAQGLATLGGAFGFLGATGAATVAGGSSRGAIATGVLLALYKISAAVAMPYVPRLCRNTDVRIAFARVQAGSAGLWCLAGIALLLGAPSMPVLLVAAIPTGLASGLMGVLRPILTKCYFGSQRMSNAVATMSVVDGLACAVGALLGGWLLSTIALGWGLVVYGLFALALAATVHRVAPTVEPVRPRVAGRPWQSAWAALKENRVVRWSAVLGVTGAIFITPIGSMVVPIAHAFRTDRPLSGASFLMTSFAIGRVCSPLVVRRLAAHRAELSAGAFATVLCGGALFTLAVVSALFAHIVGELALWVVVGVAFGATRFAAGALYFGAAADSGSADDAPRHLAAVSLSCVLTVPLGMLICGAILDGVSAEVAVLVSGAGAIIMGSLALKASRHIAALDPSAAR